VKCKTSCKSHRVSETEIIPAVIAYFFQLKLVETSKNRWTWFLKIFSNYKTRAKTWKLFVVQSKVCFDPRTLQNLWIDLEKHTQLPNFKTLNNWYNFVAEIKCANGQENSSCWDIRDKRYSCRFLKTVNNSHLNNALMFCVKHMFSMNPCELFIRQQSFIFCCTFCPWKRHRKSFQHSTKLQWKKST